MSVKSGSQGMMNFFDRAGLRTLDKDEGVTYGLGISKDKLSKAANRRGYGRPETAGRSSYHIENDQARPKSASLNCFGPKKNQHLTKARSLLSTAASNARFSHATSGQNRRGILANQLTS